MALELKEVTSSNIAKIGYDKEAQELYVKFRGGPTWRYDEVTEDEYLALMEAESLGKYFSAVIRPNHPGTKVPELEEEEKL